MPHRSAQVAGELVTNRRQHDAEMCGTLSRISGRLTPRLSGKGGKGAGRLRRSELDNYANTCYNGSETTT